MAEPRLFFALWPDAQARGRLARLAARYQPPGARPHHPDDLHMTLVFLGPVEAARQPCLYRVAQTLVAPGFELRLDRLGHWPRPRILWCAPSDTPALLQRLVADLQQGLRDCGFEPERRRYQAHVTLHRKVRHADPQPIEPPIAWRAGEFVLAASAGGAPGTPRYRILHRWALGSRNGAGRESDD